MFKAQNMIIGTYHLTKKAKELRRYIDYRLVFIDSTHGQFVYEFKCKNLDK